MSKGLKGIKLAAVIGVAALGVATASSAAVQSVSAQKVLSYQQYDINAFTFHKTYYAWHYITYTGGIGHTYRTYVSSGWNYDRWEFGYNYY